MCGENNKNMKGRTMLNRRTSVHPCVGSQPHLFVCAAQLHAIAIIINSAVYAEDSIMITKNKKGQGVWFKWSCLVCNSVTLPLFVFRWTVQKCSFARKPRVRMAPLRARVCVCAGARCFALKALVGNCRRNFFFLFLK